MKIYDILYEKDDNLWGNDSKTKFSKFKTTRYKLRIENDSQIMRQKIEIGVSDNLWERCELLIAIKKRVRNLDVKKGTL